MSDSEDHINQNVSVPLIRRNGNKSMNHDNDDDSIKEEVKLYRTVSLHIHNKDKLIWKEKKQKVFTDLMVLHNKLYK